MGCQRRYRTGRRGIITAGRRWGRGWVDGRRVRARVRAGARGRGLRRMKPRVLRAVLLCVLVLSLDVVRSITDSVFLLQSSSSSSSRKTYTSTASGTAHPLPARPDWAIGMKPSQSQPHPRSRPKAPQLQSSEFPPLNADGMGASQQQRSSGNVAQWPVRPPAKGAPELYNPRSGAKAPANASGSSDGRPAKRSSGDSPPPVASLSDSPGEGGDAGADRDGHDAA